MAEICQRVLGGFGTSVEWDPSIVVPIFKVKSDVGKCSCNRAVKHLERGMEVMERALEKMHHRIVTVNEMQIGLMPERGTTDAVLILRRVSVCS